MNENLSPPAPLNKVSTYHLGVFRGIGLWWYAQRFINNSRALFSRKILVLSHEIKDQLSKQWGYPPQKIVVAYHGLDLKTYAVWPQKRLESRRKLNIPEKDFVFILPARLVKEKRIDRAIEAFDQLAKEHDHLWLLIMGEGNLSQELKHLAGQKASRDRIIFLGYQENVVDYLSAADCYVNSSEVEGLCIALLEAMACGLICVATYCAGPTELLQNSQAGFLVGKNAEGVLEGMQKSLTLNPAERAKLIQRGIHFIRQNFELNRLVKNTLTYLQVPNKFNDAL